MTHIYVEAKVAPTGVSSVSHTSKGVWVDAVNTFDALEQARQLLGPRAYDFSIVGIHNSRANFEAITGVKTSETDTFADTVFKRDLVEDHEARFLHVPNYVWYGVLATFLTLAFIGAWYLL